MNDQLLLNVRVWDGVADAVDGGIDAVAVRDGRITFVGAAGDAPEFPSRDLGGMTLVPGLIDAHVHMCLDPEIRDPFEHARRPVEDQLAGMRRRAGDMLRAGITTARDLGGGAWLELAIRDEVNAGTCTGPRLLCAGQPITTVGGHCHFWGGEATDTASALGVLERQAAHDVDLIKVMATGGNITPGSKPVDAQFDAGIIGAIVEKARGLGFRVAAHCHGTAGIANAARAGVTTVEHCSWVGADGWGKGYDEEVVAAMSVNGVWVSPTMNAGWKRFRGNEAFVALVQGNYARMRAAGVRLIASTDAGIPNVYHDRLPAAIVEFAFFAGLTNVEALRAATSDCALAIGLGESVGRIAPGYVADMIAFDGDPLADLALLQHPGEVIARGVRVDRAG